MMVVPAPLVICRAPLRIREDVISFLDFFELGFCGFVAGVFIRVVLQGQAAVGFFYVVRSGGGGEVEYVIIIFQTGGCI